MDARRTAVSITYNKKKVTRALSPYIESVNYKDAASGKSDELSIELNNQDLRFINNWKPIKGSTISSKITLKEWKPASSTLLYHFAIDSLAASLTVFLAKIILRE